MKYSIIPAAQQVVYHCKARGIKNIVISPGSRNAPLTLGFTNDPFFNCHSIVDERAAAFFALGMAQQLRQPVAAVCTSGSALLNYYPAVAEAFYSDIPIVLISADRPVYKIDIGDGQTIRQDFVFERHIGFSANLKQDLNHARETIEHLAPDLLSESEPRQIEVEKQNNDLLNSALCLAIQNQTPVHINVPFEEPLYNLTDAIQVKCEVDPVVPPASQEVDLTEFAEIWNAASRKLVLVGVNPPETISQEFLNQLAEDPSVLVLTETTSNLHHPNFVSSIDSIIAPIENSPERDQIFSDLKPEVLLTFGGLIVSKKIKGFLRTHSPEHHWHVHPIKAYNTFFKLTHHFREYPESFLNRFLQLAQKNHGNYFEKWNNRKCHYQEKRGVYLSKIAFSDFKAFHHIIKTIPGGMHVQLANSSTVRYAQLFEIDPTNPVYCNRGTSGIDGSTSTAVGASLAANEPTVLITGDLSFLYDVNGLWNNYLRNDFRIIVINNQGGGIFRILPGMDNSENFETFFETVQDLDLKHICTHYGVEYHMADDLAQLKNELNRFYEKSSVPKLLEVITPRNINDKILLDYFDFLS